MSSNGLADHEHTRILSWSWTYQDSVFHRWYSCQGSNVVTSSRNGNVSNTGTITPWCRNQLVFVCLHQGGKIVVSTGIIGHNCTAPQALKCRDVTSRPDIISHISNVDVRNCSGQAITSVESFDMRMCKICYPFEQDCLIKYTPVRTFGTQFQDPIVLTTRLGSLHW